MTRKGCIGNNRGMNQLRQNITIPEKEIEAFCQRHHVRKLAFFGSVLGSAFTPDSDIDILIEFDPEHIPGLIGFNGMEMELEEILGHKVDLNTPQSLSRYFRERVIAEANVQYTA